jgi:uncharacterized protein YkwD
MVGVLLAAALLVPAPTSHEIDVAAERSVIGEINQQRARVHVRALTADDGLHAIAIARADDMAGRRYFDHKTPEGTIAVVDALQGSRFHYTRAGENIALASSVGDAQRGLWQSPRHRDNMLDGRFRRAGIAVVRFGAEIYVIQVFAD